MSSGNSDRRPRGRGRKKTFRPLDLRDIPDELPAQTPSGPSQHPRNAHTGRSTVTNKPVTKQNGHHTAKDTPATRHQPSFNRQPSQKTSSHISQAQKKSAMTTPQSEVGKSRPTTAGTAQLSWSTIDLNQSNLDKLLLLCHSNKELKKEGYTIRQLTHKELVSKMRCLRCHLRRKGKPLKFVNPVGTKTTAQFAMGKPVLKKARYTKEPVMTQDKEQAEHRPKTDLTKAQPAVCFWHPKAILFGSTNVYSCCKQKLNVRGCESDTVHHWEDENDPDTHLNWRFYQAEAVQLDNLTPSTEARTAVALDCEMGMAENGESELIRLTAVDFFTGATLIDKLVMPDVKITNWNTKYSGVNGKQMADARKTRQCFYGRDAARKALLQFVGTNTILIMHGGSSDLTALRLLHQYVIDSYIADTYYGGKVEGGRNLKNLIKLKTGRDIQNRGRQGHDSLEDALAARELVIHFMEAIPDHEEDFVDSE